MNNRRALYASLVGAVFTLTPLLVQRSTESDSWRTVAGLFMAPGVLVGIGVAGGVVHWAVWQVIVAVNFVFYSGFAYLILALRAKLRERNQDRALPDRPHTGAKS
jgi:hypothetical protein